MTGCTPLLIWFSPALVCTSLSLRPRLLTPGLLFLLFCLAGFCCFGSGRCCGGQSFFTGRAAKSRGFQTHLRSSTPFILCMSYRRVGAAREMNQLEDSHITLQRVVLSGPTAMSWKKKKKGKGKKTAPCCQHSLPLTNTHTHKHTTRTHTHNWLQGRHSESINGCGVSYTRSSAMGDRRPTSRTARLVRCSCCHMAAWLA